MIDYNDNQQLFELSQELIKYSHQYNTARQLSAKAKHSLDIILASRMNELRQKKSNLGYETAQIMLLENAEDEVKKIYQEYVKQTGVYKGLEKVLQALQSQISLVQSIIKNQVNNT
jgi:hypothetical protein